MSLRNQRSFDGGSGGGVGGGGQGIGVEDGVAEDVAVKLGVGVAVSVPVLVGVKVAGVHPVELAVIESVAEGRSEAVELGLMVDVPPITVAVGVGVPQKGPG